MDPVPAAPWSYSHAAAPYMAMHGLQFFQPQNIGATYSAADYVINAGEHIPEKVLGVLPTGPIWIAPVFTVVLDATGTFINAFAELWSPGPSGDMRTLPWGSTGPVSFRVAGVAPFVEITPGAVQTTVPGLQVDTPLFVRFGRRLNDPGGVDNWPDELIFLGLNIFWQDW